MSRHIIAKEIDTEYAGKFPESDKEYTYSIECPEGNGCSGWSECQEEHTVNGISAVDGPYDSNPEDPWDGCDEFEFHGQVHEWRWGHGWTVPFVGCVVQHNSMDFDLPDTLYGLPPGRYVVEDDWDDTDLYLEYVGPEEV